MNMRLWGKKNDLIEFLLNFKQPRNKVDLEIICSDPYFINMIYDVLI